MTDICQRCISRKLICFVKFIHFAPYPSFLPMQVGNIHQFPFSPPFFSFVISSLSLYFELSICFLLYSGIYSWISGLVQAFWQPCSLCIYQNKLCTFLLKSPFCSSSATGAVQNAIQNPISFPSIPLFCIFIHIFQIKSTSQKIREVLVLFT